MQGDGGGGLNEGKSCMHLMNEDQVADSTCLFVFSVCLYIFFRAFHSILLSTILLLFLCTNEEIRFNEVRNDDKIKRQLCICNECATQVVLSLRSLSLSP